MIDIKTLLDPVILSSFSFLIFFLILLYFTAKKMKNMKFFFTAAVILLAWFLVVSILGMTDFFSKNPLFAPWLLISFLILFQLLRMAYNSQIVKTAAENVSQPWITAIQIYRVVGVGFIFLYFQGVLPAWFAFPAGIGDMIVGITAPFVAVLYYLKKPYSRKLAIWWNIIGIADLVIAIATGMTGFPRPIQFVPVTPSTEPISLFPLMIIPLFAVPLAFLLHFCSLRVLREKKNI